MRKLENWRIELWIVLFVGSFSFAQTKVELINSIIKNNQLESNCIGIACSESTQFQNFQKLKNISSDDELHNLTKHSNAVLRTYAIFELIDSGKGNIPELFEQELNKNEEVTTFKGCIISSDYTYSEVYHRHWNNLLLKEYEEETPNLIRTDSILMKLDSIVIYHPKDIYWLLYKRAFENRKYDESYLPGIKELAFEKNNSYAFEYLINNYPKEFSEETNVYFRTIFPKITFKSKNEIFYLHSFLEFLFESGNDEFIQIAKAKLKNEKSWKSESSWFKNSFKKYGVEF